MNFQYPQTVLQIFSKAPIMGQVKTRLMPALNAEQAAMTHRQLCEQTLNKMARTQLCPIQLWCSPDPSHVFFQHLASQYTLSRHTQQGNDLGARMDHAIQTGLKDYRQVILIGTDSPSLGIHEIELGIQALATQTDLVIAPTEDGGYCLIGMNRPFSGVFNNIVWGQAQVLNQTLGYLNRHQITYTTLPMQWDVDRYDDFLRWQSLNA